MRNSSIDEVGIIMIMIYVQILCTSGRQLCMHRSHQWRFATQFHYYIGVMNRFISIICQPRDRHSWPSIDASPSMPVRKDIIRGDIGWQMFTRKCDLL